VYRSDDEGVCIGGDGVLTGEPVLPGFRLSLRELFLRMTPDKNQNL